MSFVAGRSVHIVVFQDSKAKEMKLDHEAAIYFRDQFREARAKALRDAEGFQEVLFVLEKGLDHTLQGGLEVLVLMERILRKRRSFLL